MNLGFGAISGSCLVGYLMDHNHRLTEREYCQKNNHPTETRINLKSPEIPPGLPHRSRPHEKHLVDRRLFHRDHRRLRRLPSNPPGRPHHLAIFYLPLRNGYLHY